MGVVASQPARPRTHALGRLRDQPRPSVHPYLLLSVRPSVRPSVPPSFLPSLPSPPPSFLSHAHHLHAAYWRLWAGPYTFSASVHTHTQPRARARTARGVPLCEAAP